MRLRKLLKKSENDYFKQFNILISINFLYKKKFHSTSSDWKVAHTEEKKINIIVKSLDFTFLSKSKNIKPFQCADFRLITYIIQFITIYKRQ